MEYKQVRRYLLLMISGCIIYLFYSIIVVYYDTQAIKSDPIKSYKIVSEHSGAINITSYIIVRYMSKEYTVTVSRKDINDPQFRNLTNSLRALRSKPPRMRFLLFKLAFCHVLTDMIV